MSAEAHIRDLMNRYCFAIDSGDFKTFQHLFEHAHSDAAQRFCGPTDVGGAGR